jgi:pimeloyl-ACP methyl ester carboxylesterase
MRSYPGIDHWFIGAHTWEAAIAAYYALKNPDTLSGIVFWAGRMYAEYSLADSKLPVLMVYGSKDDVNENLVAGDEPYLPKQTQWVEIPGGNRVNFANFGPMPRDVGADISIQEQQRQAFQATVDFMALSLK